MRKLRPLIGLTADVETRDAGSTETEYVLRANYASAIIDAGGLPVILPHDPDLAALYVAQIDGLIVTGGLFDIHPIHYGETLTAPLKLKEDRTDFELAMLDGGLMVDMPIMGICNGMQLLAVKLGGKLVQDIQRDIEGGIEHLPSPVPDKSAHGVALRQGSVLSDLAGVTTARVNSLHHQAVVPANGYDVSATSVEDGVAEAIEAKGRRFCVGVQWHPEYHTSTLDRALLDGFVAAAAQYTSQKTDPTAQRSSAKKRAVGV
ncbi:gamma-glutamyl-gamma-aminobutyrate hydrolase family protein [Pseudohalocynthiibacter aestuariivivens]|nr:gamma-glutamyl-gamma-aminobutyrate hydrolase family protein [Pseudohalocynthiibacter aestuariivivens]QIE45195.1 gamma-glutamyl-gamma-aminobutyrate hydrolase family protein [Pseudohalocynthiibacter aestuariivivens]